MNRSTLVAMVVVVVLCAAGLFFSLRYLNANTSDCKSLGGEYVSRGGHLSGMCVKDGLIVKVYQ